MLRGYGWNECLTAFNLAGRAYTRPQQQRQRCLCLYLPLTDNCPIRRMRDYAVRQPLHAPLTLIHYNVTSASHCKPQHSARQPLDSLEAFIRPRPNASDRSSSIPRRSYTFWIHNRSDSIHFSIHTSPQLPHKGELGSASPPSQPLSAKHPPPFERVVALFIQQL